jgi:hypothetical protein
MNVSFFLSPTHWMPPVSRYGLALLERREVCGYRTQRDLARAIKALSDDGVLPGDLKPFSQQWLSILEDDRSGEAISNARPRLIRALAYMLRLSADEFTELVGVSIGAVPVFDPPLPARTAAEQGWSAPKQERPVPEALIEAARLFGAQPEFRELSDPRWQRFLTDLQHKRQPHTAGEWLKVFVDLQERLDPPQDERGSVNR